MKSVEKFLKRVLRQSNSQASVKNYRDGLNAFLGWMDDADPDGLVRQVEGGEIDIVEILNDYIDHLHSKGLSPATMRTYVSIVKKFLLVNCKTLNGVNWKLVELPTLYRVERDRIPTKDEIEHVLSYGNIKDVATVLFKMSSGCRDNTMANLNIGDIDFEMFPDVAVIRVRAEITKDRVEHVTFITPEAVTALRRYLDLRRREGEDLGPDTPIFAYKGKRQLPPSFSQRWRRLLKKSGKGVKKRLRYDIHFHVLRKFFRTSLDQAGVGSAFRERLMGHKGEGYADSYFGPEIESLLSEYRKAIPHLTLAHAAVDEISIRKKVQMDELERLYRNEPEKLRALRAILARVTTEQELRDAQERVWNIMATPNRT